MAKRKRKPKDTDTFDICDPRLDSLDPTDFGIPPESAKSVILGIANQFCYRPGSSACPPEPSPILDRKVFSEYMGHGCPLFCITRGGDEVYVINAQAPDADEFSKLTCVFRDGKTISLRADGLVSAVPGAECLDDLMYISSRAAWTSTT